MGRKNRKRSELKQEVKSISKRNERTRTSTSNKKSDKKNQLKGLDKYLSLFNSSTEAVLLVNVKTGKIRGANPSAYKLYGYKTEELLNKSFRSLRAKPKDIITNGKDLPHKKNDKIFPVEISTFEIKIKSINYRVEIIKKHKLKSGNQINITDQAEFLKNVINSSPIFIYVKDISGKFVLTNKNWSRNLKFTPKGIIGKTVFDVFPDRTIAKEMTRDDEEIIRGEKNKIEKDERYTDNKNNIGWLHTRIKKEKQNSS